MQTDTERAIELAKWHESTSRQYSDVVFNGVYRDTARLLREYAGMAERVGKLEDALRTISNGDYPSDDFTMTKMVSWSQDIAGIALAPPAKEPADERA
jgi:hypothetical protein